MLSLKEPNGMKNLRSSGSIVDRDAIRKSKNNDEYIGVHIEEGDG